MMKTKQDRNVKLKKYRLKIQIKKINVKRAYIVNRVVTEDKARLRNSSLILKAIEAESDDLIMILWCRFVF